MIRRKMFVATPYCTARANWYRCYVSRAKGRQRFFREFNVLMKKLENDSKLCGNKVFDLFQTQDFYTKRSIVLTLPDNGEEIRIRDVLPRCIAGIGRPVPHQQASSSRRSAFEDDGLFREAGSHLPTNRVCITSA
jgi:hypothetical protein